MILRQRLSATQRCRLWTRRPYSMLTTMIMFAIWSLAQGFASVSKSFLPTILLESVDQRQLAVLDGAEWASIQRLASGGGAAPSANTKYGYTTVVVGKDNQGATIVGMQSSEQPLGIYQESAAKVPVGVNVEDALATYIASISTVHAVLPRSEKVGGSDESVVGGKVVVVGSSDLACFAAEGLACFGVHVCMVSTGSPKVKPSKVGKSEFYIGNGNEDGKHLLFNLTMHTYPRLQSKSSSQP